MSGKTHRKRVGGLMMFLISNECKTEKTRQKCQDEKEERNIYKAADENENLEREGLIVFSDLDQNEITLSPQQNLCCIPTHLRRTSCFVVNV